MAGRGPPPIDGQIRRLRGSQRGKGRGRPFNPSSGSVRCPRWLPVEARREWQRAAPELIRQGVLKPVHVPLFVSYCLACGEIREHTEALAIEGAIVDGPRGGKIRNPRTKLLHDAVNR